VLFYQPLQKWTLSFAADEVITDDSEDNLQTGDFTVQNIAKNVGMEILPEKSEMWHF
jgi:rRNA maturation endonuclease Nob1